MLPDLCCRRLSLINLCRVGVVWLRLSNRNAREIKRGPGEGYREAIEERQMSTVPFEEIQELEKVQKGLETTLNLLRRFFACNVRISYLLFTLFTKVTL